METLECIRKRRAIRCFTDQPVPDDILQQILEAGRWAPGAAGYSAFEFLVVQSEEGRKKIRDMAWEVAELTRLTSTNWNYDNWNAEVMGQFSDPREAAIQILGGRFLTEKSTPEMFWNPPVSVIVLADQDKRESHVYHTGCFSWQHTLSAACACMNMWLAAYDLGVGATWLTFYDPVRLKAAFNIETYLDVVGVMLFGYPPEWPADATGAFHGMEGLYPRRPLEDITHYEVYDREKRARYVAMDPFVSWITPEERRRRTRAAGGHYPGDPIGPEQKHAPVKWGRTGERGEETR